jgi:GAF domain-containing protein
LHQLVAVTRLLGEEQERGGADVSAASLTTAVPPSVAAAEGRTGEMVRMGFTVQLTPAAMIPRSVRTFQVIFVHQETPSVSVSIKVYNDISRYVACQTSDPHLAVETTLAYWGEARTPLPCAGADSERGRGPTGTAARTAEAVVLDDCASDPTGQPWRARAFQRGYRSSIAIPLRAAEDLGFGTASLRAGSECRPA